MHFPTHPLARLALITCTAFALPSANAAEITLPVSFAGKWETVGRAKVETGNATVTISNGFVADRHPLTDCEMTFRAQAPASSDNVQIWAALRVKDRDSRYVFALRGGAEPQISLARYAPDGHSKFLGFSPLDTVPQPGMWYRLRAVVIGTRFLVFLGDEKLPRINIDDTDALWREGGVALGGGWLPTTFTELQITELDAEKIATFKALGNQVLGRPTIDKSAQRIRERAAYLPATVPKLPVIRGEFPLDGKWLFYPDQDLTESMRPEERTAGDQDWHVIPVPAFWTPTLGWLHGESGLPGLKGLSSSVGPADRLVSGELDRVDAQTFEWSKTKAGWYRHHLRLPDNLAGREFHLVFGAIAKVSEIWVNGTKVGSHVGMFREVDVDVTDVLRPGENVIAVHTTGVVDTGVFDPDALADTAVSVAVTNEKLKSLPHGMTNNFSGGIWQPVKLVVTNPLKVSDVFVRTALDGASLEVEISNRTDRVRSIDLDYTITGAKDGEVLHASARSTPVQVPANGKATLTVSTPKLSPKLWSPSAPHLYRLDLRLSELGTRLDLHSTRFGFRTFTVADGKLLLNGRPYWLRGGNHFPVTLRPNDQQLARRFIELAKQGNVEVTRSHAVPFTGVWFDAADELGMGVSYEGTWPWLMLKGELPKPWLLAAWKDEFSSLIKRYRNHPSCLFWTVNNEMKFPMVEQLGPEVLTKKWSVLDDMIRTMRVIDPTRPIVPDSSYYRRGADRLSKTIREQHHFDDGDIDDIHRYYGTYNPSFFHFFNGEFGKQFATPGRPLISQEMSTGYPRNDDWPSRSYQFTRYVPQAIVGDYAFEQNDPAIYLTRQAFLTKELAETIRRCDRGKVNGVLHFAYLTWFTNVWEADRIKPKRTYYELQRALQPVLVSAELFGRHFYAGDTVTRRVCIVNDSQDAGAIRAGKLRWELRDGAHVLAQGSADTPAVDYYSNHWLTVELKMPDILARPRVDAQLVLKLEAGGTAVSENSYDVTLANRAWVEVGPARPLHLFDPRGTAKATLAGVPVTPISSLDRLDPTAPLIVGDLGALVNIPGAVEKFKAYVSAGGHALLLQPGAAFTQLFPAEIKSYRATVGEIVTMQIPESPVFDGIEPLDTAWFEMDDRKLPYACSGTYEVDRTRLNVSTLASECTILVDHPAATFFKDAGSPIVRIQLGRGSVLASEMMLSAKDRDPIAGRLFRNMVRSLAP